MERLFQAIREQHPGFDVLDVKLLANQHEVADQDATELDSAFAVAVNNAEGPMDLAHFA
ncbi:hypothetical protein [Thioclava sp. DLFJ5-1]|uniref:hypothetical protein n=1 Tax=Thioclava sp. DLFJ5-1 TaxID=1915314 RepID=UPI00143B77C1|nr:hypothetical protein [Thioclava sp. DLFJ5-1]